MKYIIGIDLGTSATKVVLFDKNGNTIASATNSYELITPKNGWAEQNPSDWIEATLLGLTSILQKTQINSKDILSIGIAGQMHGIVLLDENKNVLRNSIIWCDQRTQKECRQIHKHFSQKTIIEITGNPALTGFSLSKILWVKNNEPEIYEKVKYILLPKDYLRFILTGELASDYSDATGTQLVNINTRQYDKSLLHYLGLTQANLPRLVDSIDITGNILPKISEKTGLSTSTFLVGGASDNAAAALGCGIISDKDSFLTIGSSGVLYIHTKNLVFDKLGRFHTFASAIKNEYHIMGVTQGAGLSLQWLRNNLFAYEYKEHNDNFYYWLFEQIESIPIGSNKLIFLPYLMGERTPHLDANARGVYLGLSTIHTKLHMAKSTIEGICFSILDCLNAFKENNIDISKLIITGGGAKSLAWAQMFADCLNVEVSMIKQSEGPALGVAMLAAVAAKLYPSLDEAKEHMIRFGDLTLVPNETNHRLYKDYYKIFQETYQNLKPTFIKLNEI